MRGSHGLVGRRKCCLRRRWRRCGGGTAGESPGWPDAVDGRRAKRCSRLYQAQGLRLYQAQVEAAAAASLRPRVTV